MTQRTAVVGATVIDGTGRRPVRATVLIDGERLVEVGAIDPAVLPPDVEIIDATGGFVIPGLLDANVHLFPPGVPEFVLEYHGRYEELILEAAQVLLRAGVTTVFDTWGPLAPLRRIRDGIAEGSLVGSRIFVGGHIIGFNGPLEQEGSGRLHDDVDPELAAQINEEWVHGVGTDLCWETPEGIRARVRRYLETSDVDLVKFAASGHDLPLLVFSPEGQRVIVEEAHRAGLSVQAHTMSVESLRLEVESGVDLLQHPNVTGGVPIPPETIRAIVERDVPSAALVWSRRYEAYAIEHWDARTRTFFGPHVGSNAELLIAAGAPLLLTTDGSIWGERMMEIAWGSAARGALDFPLKLGVSHVHWLEAAVERGLDPMAALLAGTRDVARAYGKSADVGSLEPGKYADLVVLDADPLADPSNYGRVSRVMKSGVVVDRAALPQTRIMT